MAEIDKIIQDLLSDDLEKKYYACKQLDTESQLPNEAIGALRIASKDPDPLIAEAANRALSSQMDGSYIPQKVTSSEGTPIGVTRRKIFTILFFSSLLCILCSLTSYNINMTAEGDFINAAGLFGLASVYFCGLVGMVIGTYLTLEYSGGHIWEPPYYIPIIICIGLGLIFLVLGLLLLDSYGIKQINFYIPPLLVGYLLGIIIILTRTERGFQIRDFIVGIIISSGLATLFLLTSYGILLASW